MSLLNFENALIHGKPQNVSKRGSREKLRQTDKRAEDIS